MGRNVGAGRQRAVRDDDGRDPREHGARPWDALVEACRRLAATALVPDSHGALARVAVTITTIHTTPWQVRTRPDDQRPEFSPPPRRGPDTTPLRRMALRE